VLTKFKLPTLFTPSPGATLKGKDSANLRHPNAKVSKETSKETYYCAQETCKQTYYICSKKATTSGIPRFLRSLARVGSFARKDRPLNRPIMAKRIPVNRPTIVQKRPNKVTQTYLGSKTTSQEFDLLLLRRMGGEEGEGEGEGEEGEGEGEGEGCV
jgi:hypothetical protein